MPDTDTDARHTTSHGRTAPQHLLAQARVRSLSARPVGPMKVVRAQLNPTHHQ